MTQPPSYFADRPPEKPSSVDLYAAELQREVDRNFRYAVAGLVLSFLCCTPAGIFVALLARRRSQHLVEEIEEAGLTEVLGGRAREARLFSLIAMGIGITLLGMGAARTIGSIVEYESNRPGKR